MPHNDKKKIEDIITASERSLVLIRPSLLLEGSPKDSRLCGSELKVWEKAGKEGLLSDILLLGKILGIGPSESV